MQAITKDNFSDYIIFDNGAIFSIKTRKFLAQKEQPNGYLMCTLLDDNKNQLTVYAHRFIYEAFNGPIPKGLVINHINENKLDNNLSNLEAITVKENCNHGTRNQRISASLKKYYARIKKALAVLDELETTLDELEVLDNENA